MDVITRLGRSTAARRDARLPANASLFSIPENSVSVDESSAVVS